MSYISELQAMGIVASRVYDIEEAMNNLHKALCKLDNSQLKAFSSKFGLIGHLDTFAREEQLRNVAIEMYNNNLRKAVKNIDFDMFPDFSDKLFYLAEEAAEMKIPGARMLCKSLCDIRKNYELKRMPFSALARKVQNIAEVNGSACRTEYLHINNDQCIGKAVILHNIARTNVEGESGTSLLFIQVELDDLNITKEEVKKAIGTAFRDTGCSHTHDCCGCISTYPTRMKRLRINNFSDTETWVVLMSWYRNI